ncbi:hypothetical protein HU200_029099 [Digitaria exilis]|uniref:Uncharacterized protein n=1 Tax=Digitaria exilis TaxID=1010633 RepID=A0A835C4F7_9POAL|nr:hypothetical protein HU200_029099 [Digitaria exilis]
MPRGLRGWPGGEHHAVLPWPRLPPGLHHQVAGAQQQVPALPPSTAHRHGSSLNQRLQEARRALLLYMHVYAQGLLG